MKVWLKDLDPLTRGTNDRMVVEFDEFVYRPLRSLWAIANHRIYEKTGNLPIRYDFMEDIDKNGGHWIEEAWICKAFAKEMRALKEQPEILADYGMSVDIEDGSWIYTYPVEMCTSCVENRSSGEIVNNPKNTSGEKMKSCFKATEKDLMKLIEFLETCVGFCMP